MHSDTSPMNNYIDPQRVRLRHLGYLRLLIVEIFLIASLPLCIVQPWLLSFWLVLLCLVLMIFVSRFSLLRVSETRAFLWLGLAVIILEMVWRISFLIGDPLGLLLSTIHLGVWMLFIGLTIHRLIRGLNKEPSVSIRVVMGAVAGYLLIGIAGGILLNTVWVLHPLAFDTTAMQPAINKSILSNQYAPALMASSFAILSTLGSDIFTADLAGRVSAATISLIGQLYIALLIGIILGRYHKRSL